MIAIRKTYEKDSQIKFSDKSGILVQHQFKRALYYVDGEVKDTFSWDETTPITKFNEFVQSKRVNDLDPIEAEKIRIILKNYK